MIILIAAVAKNNALGKNNKLLWHLPNDFKRFKTLTTGHNIIMGRKTFESLPGILPNRTHIVITRQKKYTPESCIVVNNFKSAIEICPKNEDLYVIGGGEIYKQSIEIADNIELTVVDATFEADTFFPEIDLNLWKLTNSEHHLKDDKHKYDYSFLTYERK
jgi:dihydrofolate reductase